jgi:aminoglycoside phosphotransferase (APT) family kinase protein
MNDADEPWSEANARRRLAGLAPSLPIRIEAPQFLPSYSNDAWRIGEAVLRVCWRGDPRRFVKEAALAAALPREVGYPELLAAGEADGMTWTLTRRVEGVTLDGVWLDPDAGRVQAVLDDYVEKLRVLHAWRPSGEAAALLRAHADAPAETVEAVLGRDVVPLPMARSALLAAPAKALPHVDPAVVDAAWARMLELSALDPFAGPASESVAHCDATYPNILVDGARVSALLDFEWARLAPPWIELTAWTRLLEDLREEGVRPPPVLERLEASYPALFDIPRLSERLWLSELAYTLRHIVFWPPDAPEDALARDHPLHRLRRLIDAPIPWG